MTAELPLPLVLDIFGRCATELTRQPAPNDLATLVRRGDAPADATAWASAAWALVAEEDRRLLFLIHAALSDEDVLAATGPLPADTAARVGAVATRLGPSMRSAEAFADKLRHEALARQVAAVLNLPIVGEREATTRHLRTSTDTATQAMEGLRQDFHNRLNAARSAVDSKHAPARPYGE